MKQIIMKMFNSQDSSQDIELIKKSLKVVVDADADIKKELLEHNYLLTADKQSLKILEDYAKQAREDIKSLESKLEKAIAAMEVMIVRHNDLSKEFRDSLASKNKTKFIQPQK